MEMNPGVFKVIILGVLIVSSCKASKGTKTAELAKSETQQVVVSVPEPEPIPPGHTTVTARVQRIHPVAKLPGDLDFCADYPCHATVLITGITLYGMDYHGQFEVGTQLDACFELTLAPASEFYPQLAAYIPGLSEGSEFKALIYEEESHPHRAFVFKIYELINQ